MADLSPQRTPPAIAPSALLEALAPAARFSLRGGPEALAAAAAVLAVPESGQPCRAQVAGGRALLWLGPDERLVLAPEAEGPLLADSVARALSMPHAWVDVSHRQIALQLRGPRAAVTLSCGCPLDLDAASFPVGMCTRTVLNKAEIVLWRTAADTFRIEVSRSFARYASRLLADAAKESQP
jgi:sarcosine oxidase, subunit gamma